MVRALRFADLFMTSQTAEKMAVDIHDSSRQFPVVGIASSRRFVKPLLCPANRLRVWLLPMLPPK